MNADEKKKLKEDAIRDSGIIDRVSNFRDFCNRYYQLTPSKNFKSMLISEVHSLENKRDTLKLAELGISVAPPTPAVPPSETQEIVTQSEDILKKIRTTIAKVEKDLEDKYKSVEEFNDLLVTLEQRNNDLADAAPERDGDFKGLIGDIKTAVNRITDETDLRKAMGEALDDLDAYYLWIKSP